MFLRNVEVIANAIKLVIQKDKMESEEIKIQNTDRNTNEGTTCISISTNPVSQKVNYDIELYEEETSNYYEEVIKSQEWTVYKTN